MIHILELPWGADRYFKGKYDLTMIKGGLTIYKGGMLPKDLRDFKSQDFSYARWIEDEKNATVLPPEPGGTNFKPRDHQKVAASKILKSFNGKHAGFLIGDKTGTGKTLSTLVGITAIARQEGFGPKNKAKLLVVCPKSVIPQWRQTLRNYPLGTAHLRVLVINYQQLNKLLNAPPQARVAKKKGTKNRQTARNGTPAINFDYIIFDEAHYLKNYPKSAMSLSATAIAKTNSPYIKGKSPFVIYSTATPGSSPLNFAVMANWLAPLINPKTTPITPALWGAFLEKQGFHVTKGKTGYNWVTMPWRGVDDSTPEGRRKKATLERDVKTKQRDDSKRIGKALLRSNAPFIMRSPTDIAGWPEQQLIPLPLELNSKQRPIYDEAWTRFRRFLNLTPAKKDPKGALVENLRYRQKTSLLKVEPLIEQVVDWVEQDKQVFISVEFMETIDEYRKLLVAKKIPVAEISGRNVKDRERERLRFQRGLAKVVISTVTAGISLHAEEDLPDGSKATSNERITLINDLRSNPLDSIQAFGRAHRDGKNSLTYIPYLDDTVDVKVVASFVNKEANLKSMTGSSDDDVDMLEKLFREAAAKTTPPNRRS